MYLNATDATLEHLVIADNALSGSYYANGGGLYAATYTDISMTNCIVANNTAGDSSFTGYGGGLYLYYYANAELENVDIVGNTVDASRYGGGGGIYGYYADLAMVNTNIVSNTATRGGALGATGSRYLGDTDITYCNIYDNGSDEYEGYSDPTGSDGNISVDPAYTDTSGIDAVDWDLALGSGSACIDAGDSSISDADGSASDIGAYGGPQGSW